MAGLNFIKEQEEPTLIANLAQAEQILRRSGCDTAFALNRFDQDRGSFRANRGAHRFQVIEGHLPKACHHRLKTFLYFFLPGRGDPREGSPVE